MAVRIRPRASAFLSGLTALALHAGAWGALELASAEREASRASPQSLVWLEPASVLAVPVGVPLAAPDKAYVVLPTAPPRARAKRTLAQACSTATAATPSRNGLALAPAGPIADSPSNALSGQPDAPAVVAPAGGARGAASGAGQGAPAPRAQLLSSSPCAGFFPGGAAADVGEVQVDVAVDATGHAALSSVLLERPAGQGFARAAQACASKLLFAPAHDGSGAAVPVHAKLRLVFKRA